MVTHLFLPSLLHSIITLLLLLLFVPKSYCEENQDYLECKKPFRCGNLENLHYPFWGDQRPQTCGNEGFRLKCADGDQFPILTINDQAFRVFSVNQSEKEMTIARMDYLETACPRNLANTTMNETLFSYDYKGFPNISLFYDCNSQNNKIPASYTFPCSRNGFYATETLLKEWEVDVDLLQCSNRVEVPVPWTTLVQSLPLDELLKEGFNVIYNYDEESCGKCMDSGGICGYNLTTSLFTCLCRDQSYSSRCPGRGKGPNVKMKIIIGIFGGIGMLFTCGVIYCFMKFSSFSLWEFKKSNQDLEAFLNNHGPLSVTRYNFSEVKRMTNFFKDKLGQGGYGSVYKGKLVDGRFVAVKVLNSSKGEGEEFINEVASIMRTSHVNIVTLLGFCLQGQNKALIYEFMPNGSLEKCICSRSILKTNQLEWKIMHQIAIGIARGLEYLHRGCNTRIVHFDIKPHNILLDENFCPKISDFGLAKLYTKTDSIISMLEARGTIGYIAPEVFSRNFGGVSYKSDVYSYGMMVLEMTGGREKDENGGDETSTSSEKYFPYWVYKRLELGNECELYGEISIEETEIVRKMTLVGLWCIQTNPLDRPSMSKVIQMLEGSSQTLTIPPKPFLFSPPKSPPLCSFTTSMA